MKSNAMANLTAARKKHGNFQMKCIVPDNNSILCNKPCIRSHSIQHNGILSRLSQNGKVYFLGESTNNTDLFKYALKSMGISTQASIFKCLCKDHDKQLFIDIEDREYCNENVQNFQYALKALLFSYWSKCNGRSMSIDYPLEHPLAGRLVRHIADDIQAYSKELNRFWEILKTGQYQDLLCWTLKIDHEVGAAVSESINVLRKFDGSLFGDENKEYPLLHISLFPAEGKSYLLVSCLKEYREYFKAFINQFMLLSERAILKRFNILLPLLADNIAISPRIVDAMTDKQKKELLTVFRLETMAFYNKHGINVDAWAKEISYDILNTEKTI